MGTYRGRGRSRGFDGEEIGILLMVYSLPTHSNDVLRKMCIESGSGHGAFSVSQGVGGLNGVVILLSNGNPDTSLINLFTTRAEVELFVRDVIVSMETAFPLKSN